MSKSKVPKNRKRTKKINFDVYNAGDEEELAERLLKRRGGGGSQRNYDEFVEDENDFQTENIDRENDEEITEDEAFDEDDEDKFGMFFKKKEVSKSCWFCFNQELLLCKEYHAL